MLKKIKKSVSISEEDSQGKDEWWCNWYKCPGCKSTSIAGSFKFCPDCGLKLNWKK